jgi:hypothetical protein
MLAAGCVGATAAEAATPPVAGWHAPGVTSATSTSSSTWRMPNGQEPAASDEIENPVNPLRPRAKPVEKPREPGSFDTPAGATPIRFAQSANNAPAAHNIELSAAVADVAQTAAVLPNKPAANNRHPVASTARPAANGRPRYNPRVARSSPATRGMSSPHEPIWRRLNVAMQGMTPSQEGLEAEAEDLPMPREAGPPMSDPFGADPFGGSIDGEYYPSCGPDGCGGGCGDACACGGACEPGCGCCSGCGDGCYDCHGECCNDCLCIGPGDPESCHTVRIRLPKWQELNFFAGVQGFKGPYDQERDSGNFGFHEGFNSGFKIPYTFAGYQIGYQSAQSQLNGDEQEDIDESHSQHFTTFGLFRRATDGLQFGTAWDVLVDERFKSKAFHQLRSELSWLDCGTHEFGFSATVGLNGYEDRDDDELSWQAADQYVLFYRVHGKRGGEGRFYAGWSDDSDGILGADMMLPVHDRWSVQTGFTYLIPEAEDGEDGASEEAWNIHLAMVWHWGCTARSSHTNPYRPLFNVANNGHLIVDSRENDD